MEDIETFTLLVYWGVPEHLDYYVIPNTELSAEVLSFLRQAQGKYVNSDDDNEGMRFLLNACVEKKSYCEEDAPKEWKCAFLKYKRDTNAEALENVNITRVFTSGFFE